MNAPDPASAVFLNEETEKKVVVMKDTKIVNACVMYCAKEDHTLGNLLRYELLRDRDVRFAGYRMIHPLMTVLEVKVQTVQGVDPLVTIISALESLQTEFETLENRFREQVGRGQDTSEAVLHAFQ